MPDREFGSDSLVDPRTSLDGFSEDRSRAVTDNYRFLPVSEETVLAGNGASSPAGSGDSILPAPDDGLSPQKRLALAGLLCGRTTTSVAAQVGVCVKTIYNWRHEPAFAAALHARSHEALETCAVRARNLLLKSTMTLNDALNTRDRFNWALKMVNAQRLWNASQTLPVFDKKTGDDS